MNGIRVTRPRDMNSYLWNELLNHWPSEATTVQEAVYYLMSEIIAAANLPLPVRYKGRIVSTVPIDDTEYYVALSIAQYKRVVKEMLRRDEEQAEAERKLHLQREAKLREERYLQGLRDARAKQQREIDGRVAHRTGTNPFSLVGGEPYDTDDIDDTDEL